MPNWRRAHVPGGTYFFTVVTNLRAPFLCDIPARPLLGSILRRCQSRWPFDIPAIVLLPDHLHTIWTLPRGDEAYPRRWAWIKRDFTKHWAPSRRPGTGDLPRSANATGAAVSGSRNIGSTQSRMRTTSKDISITSTTTRSSTATPVLQSNGDGPASTAGSAPRSTQPTGAPTRNSISPTLKTPSESRAGSHRPHRR